ncbi:response regulator [Comamonas sp. J-3]|uniref:response regulator n=1 Tax=Comamonas trifloxystrobinivorans TaxID=3350256 RepID=UPI00372C7B58
MSDALYRQFLDHFADDFFLHDDQGRILDVNAQACASMGYSKHELLRMCVQDFALDFKSEELVSAWRGIAPFTKFVATNTHQRKDGTRFPVEVHISCQIYEGRKCFFTMARNITERVRGEEQIRQLNAALERQVQERTQQWQDSTRLLNAVMHGTSDIVFVKDLQGRYVFGNPAADQLAQVPPGGLVGRTDAELLGGDNGFADDDAQVLTSDTPVVSETFAVVDGERRLFQSIKSQYRDEDGQVIGLLGISRDITEVRRAAQELRMSYDSLRRAERQARIGSWTLELATGEFKASEMMYEMNGADPQGPLLTPADLQRMLRPDDHARVLAAIQRCAQTGQAYDLDVMHLSPQHGWFPASIRGQADRDAEGRIVSVSGTVQDLSERVDAKLRLETLADNLPNGAIYRVEGKTKEDVRMTYISAGIEQLIGLSADTITSDRAAYLRAIHPEDREAYVHKAFQVHTRRSDFDHRFRIIHTNGSVRWLHCRSAPRSSDQGTTWDGIMLDITREVEAEQALQAAKSAAEAAERAKSDFLATMSHEIRTPMNTVIGMTRLVQQTPLTPKQRNYLEKVELSANALLSIINDILDFSKIEAGMLALEQTDFRLDDILETVSAVTSLRAEEKGIEVVYAMAPDVPRQLRGDPLRLGQVLNNLVSNAIKFTEQGEVVVSIGLAAAPKPVPTGQTLLSFSVKDTGIGLTQAQIQQLFRPFSQADSQTTRRYGGTGLGLAICNRLVELMGGEIDVHSQPGQGSVFHFTAALQPAHEPQPQTALAPLASGERVLIVDDNASAREILCSMVGGFGMRADAADSGEQALQLLHAASRSGSAYGLVLMDWRMPGMDGLEVARRIREEENLATTPAVLMVTAYGREEVQRRAEALRLQGLLIKPVTESVLFNAILEILQSHGNPAQPAKAPLSMPPLQAMAQLYPTLRGTRVLVVDDNALNREVAADFLALAGVQVQMACDGVQALQLLKTQSFDAVLMDVHMPHMDGLDATRAIRNELGLGTLPVIALTAQARPEDRARIEAAGMNAHLTKPIDDHQLYATLQSWISGTPAAAQLPASGERLRQRLQHRPERMQRILQGFVRDFVAAPTQLLACWQQGRWADLGMLAHTLKGSLGYLDAPALVAQAATVEQHAYQLEPMAIGSDAAATLQAQLAAGVPTFSAALQQLLEQLSASAHNTNLSCPAPGTAASAEHWQTLLDELRALIAAGDYAAVEALEALGRQLGDPAARSIFQDIQQYTEDLETEAALQALQRLQTLLCPPGLQRH